MKSITLSGWAVFVNLFCPWLSFLGAEEPTTYILSWTDIASPSDKVNEWSVSSEMMGKLEKTWPDLDSLHIKLMIDSAWHHVRDDKFVKVPYIPELPLPAPQGSSRRDFLEKMATAKMMLKSVELREIGYYRAASGDGMLSRATGRTFAIVSFTVRDLQGALVVYVLSDGTAVRRVEREATAYERMRLEELKRN